MYNRLISFINKHDLLCKFQFGFREDHSTNLALIYLVDKISNSLDTGEYVLRFFLDFTKAFDTFNHAILLQKLEHLCVRGISLNWFESYLSNWSQYVNHSGISSELQYIHCGVPQGSILRPLLFLLYINDLSYVSSLVFILLFANDSNMFLSGKNPNVLIDTMNTEIERVLEWLDINKLMLNVKKTHYMFFRKSKAKLIKTLDIMIEGQIIDMVDVTKFLGVYIDACLSWGHHIQNTRNKIAKGLGMICSEKGFTEINLTDAV